MVHKERRNVAFTGTKRATKPSADRTAGSLSSNTSEDLVGAPLSAEELVHLTELAWQYEEEGGIQKILDQELPGLRSAITRARREFASLKERLDNAHERYDSALEDRKEINKRQNDAGEALQCATRCLEDQAASRLQAAQAKITRSLEDLPLAIQRTKDIEEEFKERHAEVYAQEKRSLESDCEDLEVREQLACAREEATYIAITQLKERQRVANQKDEAERVAEQPALDLIEPGSPTTPHSPRSFACTFSTPTTTSGDFDVRRKHKRGRWPENFMNVSVGIPKMLSNAGRKRTSENSQAAPVDRRFTDGFKPKTLTSKVLIFKHIELRSMFKRRASVDTPVIPEQAFNVEIEAATGSLLDKHASVESMVVVDHGAPSFSDDVLEEEVSDLENKAKPEDFASHIDTQSTQDTEAAIMHVSRAGSTGSHSVDLGVAKQTSCESQGTGSASSGLSIPKTYTSLTPSQMTDRLSQHDGWNAIEEIHDQPDAAQEHTSAQPGAPRRPAPGKQAQQHGFLPAPVQPSDSSPRSLRNSRGSRGSNDERARQPQRGAINRGMAQARQEPGAQQAQKAVRGAISTSGDFVPGSACFQMDSAPLPCSSSSSPRQSRQQSQQHEQPTPDHNVPAAVARPYRVLRSLNNGLAAVKKPAPKPRAAAQHPGSASGPHSGPGQLPSLSLAALQPTASGSSSTSPAPASTPASKSANGHSGGHAGHGPAYRAWQAGGGHGGGSTSASALNAGTGVGTGAMLEPAASRSTPRTSGAGEDRGEPVAAQHALPELHTDRPTKNGAQNSETDSNDFQPCGSSGPFAATLLDFGHHFLGSLRKR